jgi:dynamin-like GTPase MGM1, mitochondrial
MSGRLVAVGLRPTTRRAFVENVRHLHRFPTGGLLRADASIRATRRRMWFEGNAFHNAVTARNASFGRFLPKLAVKLLRVPALLGSLAIAWVQYQATRESQ